MKVYTKKGDQGLTALFGSSQPVHKNHPRVQAYGIIDELNSVVGLLRSSKVDSAVNEKLYHLQNLLFVLGSELANLKDTPENQQESFSAHTEQLEVDIDTWSKNLKPLKNFILPGGSVPSAYAHLARTVCRRAERACIPLIQDSSLRPQTFSFINRLSDWFFVLARVLNNHAGQEDVIWTRN